MYRKAELRRAAEIIEKIAREHGVTPDYVRSEIDFAVREALATCTDEAKMMWDMCPRAGEIPTPEEVIIFLSGIIRESGAD